MTTVSKSAHDFVSPLVRDLPKSGIRDFFDIVASRKDVISLGIGEPDFQTPWHIREKAITSLERGMTRYTSNLGMPELRQELAGYMRDTFRAEYDWQTEILVTVGVSEGFDIAMRAVLSPGDEVLYHEPCFVAYAPLIRMAQGVPVAVETFRRDEFRLTVEELEKKVTPRTRVLLVSFPNNPTGATLRREDTEALADFVIRHDLLLVSDEVYSELTYEGGRHSLAAIPRLRDRLIFLNGFSKAWSMTGFRLGYVCAPAPLTDAMMKIHQYCMMCASSTAQMAGIEALQHGAADVAAMRESYHLRRNYIVASLNEMGLDCFMPRGAFYVFPSIQSTGLDSTTFALRLLNECNVACIPGTAFGACGAGFLRCAYATGMEQLKEAMDRMAAFVQRL
ncbi:MAG TPA: aminotransferase class I/II-fold pyridoxal phosphate-dependent enzyme [Kiritimatiellia bacterium]|jgi:aminotransferase|nr:aminotransferase class I/II-fold pyridoxal phosphate-dependent enzyme [Kiritimatiellia bacterium]HOR97816.1 aminotransferase class I/II-fold pyridoxal phosphate-dependent enzyme [Kiritimatiellia bacterium]HPC49260.1 aminotransferase class I/II-fold pyridoxal phosphate-dependent enzyme [Kiritimatiellia bacterium]HPK36795.1 aminotransferase class I/II-fold pyridoxal phosphate-dependent enzyme [Kiritimatiellia bacterium]HRU18956.1 aminotransferase class I/II-fold pyridoxal phosphate-dependent e